MWNEPLTGKVLSFFILSILRSFLILSGPENWSCQCNNKHVISIKIITARPLLFPSLTHAFMGIQTHLKERHRQRPAQSHVQKQCACTNTFTQTCSTLRIFGSNKASGICDINIRCFLSRSFPENDGSFTHRVCVSVSKR